MAGFDDLTDDERAAIVKALRQAIDNDRYRLSPRMEPFKSALAKLGPRVGAEESVERRCVAAALGEPADGSLRLLPGATLVTNRVLIGAATQARCPGSGAGWPITGGAIQRANVPGRRALRIASSSSLKLLLLKFLRCW